MTSESGLLELGGIQFHLLLTHELMVLANAITAVAYFAIASAICIFMRNREASPAIHRIVSFFAGSIGLCGVIHLVNIWSFWHPDFARHAFLEFATTTISIAAAVSFWALLPKVLKIPSPSSLQATIVALKAEVERRHTPQDSLAETQLNLALHLASVDVGFVSTDRAGNITRMNVVAEDVLGWKNAEALGLSIWTVFARTDRPAAYLTQNPIDVMTNEGFSLDVPRQIEAISKTGKRTTVEVRSSLIQAGDGSVGGLTIVFRDMTKTLRLEAETDRLAEIIAVSRDAVIGKSLDGIITSWNGAAQSIFGYTASEAIGQPISILVPPDRRAEEAQILRQFDSNVGVPPFETTRQTKDGRNIKVSIAISPIHNLAGTVISASKTARNVTEIHTLGDAKQSLALENRSLEEIMRLKSQFLARMTHELRTPLNAIVGFTDLLQGGSIPVDSAKHREFLWHIGNSSRHLLALVNDVLDLSKAEAGKITFAPESIDLRDVIVEAVEVVQYGLLKKSIEMTVAVSPDLRRVVLDPSRLKQVLFNLLSNAIRFTADGGIVMVRALPEGPDHFRLEVEDTGIGIAAESIPRLFVDFQQIAPPKAVPGSSNTPSEGTGLGLALTRRLVQAQGGSVGVISTVGKGSVFHAVLNRVHGTDAARHVDADISI